MAETFASSDMSESGQSSIDSLEYQFFDPLYFVPIMSWEQDMVEGLASERDREELEWLVDCLQFVSPMQEDLEPMDLAYPFRSCDIDEYVSFLLGPQGDIYEYDGKFYLGPDACYGFRDEDFVYLDDDDRDVPVGLPPGLWHILFPPAAEA